MDHEDVVARLRAFGDQPIDEEVATRHISCANAAAITRSRPWFTMAAAGLLIVGVPAAVVFAATRPGDDGPQSPSPTDQASGSHRTSTPDERTNTQPMITSSTTTVPMTIVSTAPSTATANPQPALATNQAPPSTLTTPGLMSTASLTPPAVSAGASTASTARTTAHAQGGGQGGDDGDDGEDDAGEDDAGGDDAGGDDDGEDDDGEDDGGEDDG